MAPREMDACIYLDSLTFCYRGIKPGHYRWRRGLKLTGYTKEYEAKCKVEVIAEASSYNTR